MKIRGVALCDVHKSFLVTQNFRLLVSYVNVESGLILTRFLI